MNEEKIINRIRKMLALASDKAATEGERDNALRMAYTLMAKYNIDQAQVEAAGGKAADPRINFAVDGWSMVWSAHIYQAIGRLFFCKYYRGNKINGTKQTHHFVGKESNAVTASYLAAFVVISILKEGRSKGWHNLSAQMRAFGLGAASKLYERVKEIQQKAEQQQGSSSGTEIVLASIYKTELQKNMDFLSSQGLRLKKGNNGREVKDRGAFAAGREFGDTVNLNRQIGAPGSNVRLLGES